MPGATTSASRVCGLLPFCGAVWLWGCSTVSTKHGLPLPLVGHCSCRILVGLPLLLASSGSRVAVLGAAWRGGKRPCLAEGGLPAQPGCLPACRGQLPEPILGERCQAARGSLAPCSPAACLIHQVSAPLHRRGQSRQSTLALRSLASSPSSRRRGGRSLPLPLPPSQDTLPSLGAPRTPGSVPRPRGAAPAAAARPS